MQIAADAARREAARLKERETHSSATGAHRSRGQVEAYCGSYVNLDDLSPEPTCQTCRETLAEMEDDDQ